ncbi:MAG TPA: host attachment family protein [Xanthobacteraceae bacterium]|nr:host attachment family protein [Xanthobacteraceae bacterium]
MHIPHDALVFVGDGQKALFLRNKGDSIVPNLRVERVFTDENPPTHEQGTDRPGRAFKRAGTNLRSSVETTDWHELEKHRFVGHVATAMEKFVHIQGIKKIVVVAPPRTLAELREAFDASVKGKIIAEVGKDLTNSPIWQIEKHLTHEAG